MSRIRSIHPGLWTDEAFVCLSAMGRLLFMGIWNECDDMGSFEWSPLKLKMRLLPADSVDAAALLAEMEASGSVMRYEKAGKAYGAVRNFCQYQRPKKPNSVYPQTDEIRAWVNLAARSTRDGSEEVGKELPTGGEKPRQMEDEGGDKETDLARAKPVKARKRASRTPEFEVPDWVPAEPWAAFLAMRGRKKAPVDSYIAKQLFEKLDGFRADGWDIAKVLDKATLNNWTTPWKPTPGRDDDLRAGSAGKGGSISTEERQRLDRFRADREAYERGDMTFDEMMARKLRPPDDAPRQRTGPRSIGQIVGRIQDAA